MIKHLSIRNYILIDQLDLDFQAGLHIVTGETGAGKSILMGALDLIAGERADLKSLRNPEEKCIIEAWFSDEKLRLNNELSILEIENENETIIRREILPGGKSRAFVNDTPVTLDALKKIGNLLLDIHGQHDTLLLANAERQLDMLDILASTAGPKEKYAIAFKNWRSNQISLHALIDKREKENAELGFKQFVFDELQKADIKKGEQVQLEAEADLLRNAEGIKLKLNQTIDILEGQTDVVSALKSAASQLEKLGLYSTTLSLLSERAKGAFHEIKDILDEVKDVETGIQHNPEKQASVEERLSLIYNLQKKHRKETEEELLDYANSLSYELENFNQLDDEIEVLKKNQVEFDKDLKSNGLILTEARKKGIQSISEKMQSLLADMGMANARFEIQFLEIQPQASGFDKVSFMFSANPGQALAELKNAASGGEFSRLMLALKCMLAGRQSMPTLIFDEIDTGISGEVALKVGKIIKDLATRHQVFAITHSAQMASQANSHWFVYKLQNAESTKTGVRLLQNSERLEEIAKMISGNKISEAAMKAAKELIES